MSLDDELRAAVDERVQARREANAWRNTQRRRRLAELAKRRQHGLKQRHQRKLDRHQEDQPMFDYRFRTVDFRPAPPGWRVVFLDGTGRAAITPMPGWLIQEEVEVEGDEERPTGTRDVVASYVEENGVEPIRGDAYFWYVLAPGEDGPTPEEQAAQHRLREAQTKQMARAAQINKEN